MKIELLWKYLQYDVAQLTHRYSKVRLAQDPEMQFTADLGGNESDDNLVRRFCITGVARLRKILQDYISKSANDTDDTLVTDTTKWTFLFNNEDYDGESLVGLMHWFVVRFCIWQWLKMFNLAQESATEEKELKDIEDALKKFLEGAMPTKDLTGYVIEDDSISIVYTNESL